jgi:hypothetical protein
MTGQPPDFQQDGVGEWLQIGGKRYQWLARFVELRLMLIPELDQAPVAVEAEYVEKVRTVEEESPINAPPAKAAVEFQDRHLGRGDTRARQRAPLIRNLLFDGAGEAISIARVPATVLSESAFDKRVPVGGNNRVARAHQSELLPEVVSTGARGIAVLAVLEDEVPVEGVHEPEAR